MADLTTTATSSASSGYKNQSELMVETYKQTEQPKIDAITTKITSLESNKVFFSSLYNKVNALSNATDSFTGSKSASAFNTRKVTASDLTVATVTASEDAILGINTVKVNRLASYDILVSNTIQISNDTKTMFAGSNKKDEGLSAGSYSFKVGVGDEDKFTISVNFTGEETNFEAMQKIVKAVNDTDDITVTASVVKDTETTARVTFVANELGDSNKISFEDIGFNDETDAPTNGNSKKNQGILEAIGFTENLNGTDSRIKFTTTSAGYKTVNPADLDAKLEVNGIPITRSSNSIEDVLPGLTINLLKPQTEDELAVTLTTEVDTKKVVDLIQPMLANYNEVLKYLKSETTLMRNDATVSGLYNRLRYVISDSVAQGSEGDLKYLTEIGISINADGTLSMSDSDKLKEILEDDPSKVAHLFTGTDSFTNKLITALENLTGSTGIIQARTLSLSSQIDIQTKRQEELEERIDREAQALRDEYESMLAVYLQAQGQYSLLSTMSGTSASTY